MLRHHPLKTYTNNTSLWTSARSYTSVFCGAYYCIGTAAGYLPLSSRPLLPSWFMPLLLIDQITVPLSGAVSHSPMLREDYLCGCVAACVIGGVHSFGHISVKAGCSPLVPGPAVHPL